MSGPTTESETLERLRQPGVLLAVGGRMVDKLAEDVPVRDRYKRQRAGE